VTQFDAGIAHARGDRYTDTIPQIVTVMIRGGASQNVYCCIRAMRPLNAADETLGLAGSGIAAIGGA
jgi:hypothetical protein